MVIRKEPRNPKQYIMVNSDTSVILHENGFLPRFMSVNGNYMFYTKTDKIVKFMKDNNLVALE